MDISSISPARLRAGLFAGISRLYWLPSPGSPGVLDLIVELVRMGLLTFLALLATYFLFYRNAPTYSIGESQKVLYLALFVIFEEAARLNYAIRSQTPARSLTFFLVVVVGFEFVGFLVTKTAGMSTAAYLVARMPSIVVHVVSSGLCFLSIRRRAPAIWGVAVVWHVFMNWLGIAWLYNIL